MICGIVLIIIGVNQIYALQQVAGKIVAEIKPGETKTVQWGLVSDRQNDITTVELKADGKGAEFLSFPKTVRIDPGQLVFVNITVNVPSDYSNNVELNPTIYATEFGEKGGPTVMNIQMKKVLSVIIGSVNVVSTEKQEQAKPKGGGCLIATAAFGSDLAPQVQQLRETRDKVLLHTLSGTTFMTTFNQFYYTFSPTVADWERENPVFKEAVKITITPLITTLSILNYLDIDSEAKMLGYGIGVILLNIGMYFVAPAFVIIRLWRQ